MAARNSRKKTAPARLREEIWYLVKYEDDENLRVLAKDEIHHIFPDEEEGNEMQIGDIVSALWMPNGQYYDAKIMAKGEDKNDLMRERMRQEKAKTNRNKGTEAQQKKRLPEEKTGGQKKKQKTQKQTGSVKEKDQKTKDREEKQKKKEQDQERQRFLLEARKAQAASRWAANDNVNNPASATFTPEPIHLRTDLDSSPSCQSSTPLTPASSTVSYVRSHNPVTKTTCQPSTSSTPATLSVSYVGHNTVSCTITPESTPKGSLPAKKTLPARPNTAGSKSKYTSEPRRGLHFQSAIVDSSDDEEVEIIPEESETDISNLGSDCCKEQRLETKALRKRLEKVHKRLNIALKAKTTAEVVSNRPGAGILDPTLAAEYKMVEVMEGSGVFWYPHQRAYCSAFKNWAGYINAAIDIFFTKEELAVSNAKGKEKKSRNGDCVHQPLTPMIIDTLIGKVCSKFAKDSPNPSAIVQKINMKCVEARRPQRIRAPQVATRKDN